MSGNKLRAVPEDRIRTLTTIFSIGEYIPLERHIPFVIEAMGHELATKLMEFHKVQKLSDYSYKVEFDIIVPPCPENAL